MKPLERNTRKIKSNGYLKMEDREETEEYINADLIREFIDDVKLGDPETFNCILQEVNERTVTIEVKDASQTGSYCLKCRVSHELCIPEPTDKSHYLKWICPLCPKDCCICKIKCVGIWLCTSCQQECSHPYHGFGTIPELTLPPLDMEEIPPEVEF